jgi:NADP-dependent 3-hydroxy acid dehydrogenase YdfG
MSKRRVESQRGALSGHRADRERSGEGKVVAIAGASSGVGKATAFHFAALGYAVALCARREAHVRAVADGIAARGGRALAMRADMSVFSDAAAFVDRTVRTFGRVDVLFNNAGAGVRFADFEDYTLEEIDRGIALNLTSVIYGCKAVLPVMRAQKGGHIVNMSSILGKKGRSGFAVYTAGKHGVEGFSKALFNEVKKLNIRVTVLSPAMINTEWAVKAGVETPLSQGKLIEPEDIALVLQRIVEMPEHFTVWNVDVQARDQVTNPL